MALKKQVFRKMQSLLYYLIAFTLAELNMLLSAPHKPGRVEFLKGPENEGIKILQDDKN